MFNKWHLRLEDKRIWQVFGRSMALSLILSMLMIFLDTSTLHLLNDLPEWMLTDLTTARQVLATLAGTLLTVTTFVFSAILTIVTLYTSNFSPRAVEDFLLDTTSMRTLGVFLGGFIYSLTSLVFMDGSQYDGHVFSVVIAWFYAIGSALYFTKFVYQVSNYIQVDKLVSRMYNETKEQYEKNIDFFQKQTRIEKIPEIKTTYQYEMKTNRESYIGTIKFEKLAEHCREYGVICVITLKIGDFVSKDQPFATLYTNKRIKDVEKLNELFNQTIVYETERSASFDSGYSRNKLNEIALKAMSPGINDPNTAIHAVHYKSLLEAKFAALKGRYAVIGETEDIVIEEPDFSGVTGMIVYDFNDFFSHLHVGYRQLVHYMKDDISSIEAIFDALVLIAHAANEDKLSIVKEYSRYVYESVIDNFPQPLDKTAIDDRYNRILSIKTEERAVVEPDEETSKEKAE
ncbi:DUF2254 domain-containing protein [Marinilactibacillus kalidii]|uniref:DUF2254 domain-containing protein n=1 Tax=Marinilactibacillus kalidii TaxID=2820274 RepID=UPI001ABDD555|nr:DUF2254 family protein [Marinilactibacillus kalidii]